MDESRREFLGRLFGRQSLRTLGTIAGGGLGVVRSVKGVLGDVTGSAEEAGLALGRRKRPVVLGSSGGTGSAPTGEGTRDTDSGDAARQERAAPADRHERE